MPKYNTAQYNRRDTRLIEHTSLYRVLLPLIVKVAFGDGTAQGHVLKELAKRDYLIGFLRSLPGGYSYYILGPKGATRLGLASDRAALLSGSALSMAIGVACFCFLGRHRRFKLPAIEASSLLEAEVPTNVTFVLSDELEGQTKVFRVVHATSGEAKDIVRHLRVLVDQARRHSAISIVLNAKQYGFAVLGATAEAVRALENVIDRSGLRSQVPLIVDLGPDAETYAQAAKKFDRK